MRLLDTHSHPQMRQYNEDRDAVIERALDAGVGMICVGVDLETSSQAIELADKYENMWASVGLHPNDNLDEIYDDAPYFELAQTTKVIAIGEIGLDYYRTTDETKKQFQRERFEKQLQLAGMLNKPVIIHCRDAHEDMRAMLSKFPKVKGVIHSFTGTLEDAKWYIEHGFHIGLNGIITFARQYDDVVREIPLEWIVLETDAPYLTPEPYRGNRNESAYIAHVAQKIAEIRGVEFEKVAGQTTINAKSLFNLTIINI